ERKCAVKRRIPIWDMCSPTVRVLPAFVIASTRQPCDSSRRISLRKKGTANTPIYLMTERGFMMDRSFYQFVLSYRGGKKDDSKAVFAEAVFNDHSFPKDEKGFDPLSRYLEEKAEPEMPSVVFDELFALYKERF